MAYLQLNLSDDERGLLIRLLNTELGDTRVEERHTDFSPDMKRAVQREEALLRGLLDKLRGQPQLQS